jgi:hypothetical protein
MQTYTDQRFIGERALFQTKNAQIFNCIFADGESPLKESCKLDIVDSSFQWKYPLWYCHDVTVKNSTLFEMARAGIWYTNDVHVVDVLYGAPKGFRRCKRVSLKNVSIPKAEETLWNCDGVILKDVTAQGDYFGMNSENIEIDKLDLIGNYPFDGVKNVVVKNSKLISKDAFWNAENVIVYDSFISGEYLGWNSRNITFVNCTIESEQGFCYMDNVVLKNCKLINTNLAFEYATVDADIITDVLSIKNPISGIIKAKSIGQIIFDNKDVDKANTQIIVEN